MAAPYQSDPVGCYSAVLFVLDQLSGSEAEVSLTLADGIRKYGNDVLK
jgi:hypothetical protein